MKLTIFVSHNNPPKTEEIICEDVDSYTVGDNGMLVKFNDGKSDLIQFRSNDGEGELDWMNVTVQATRMGLKIDMSK